MNTSIDLTPGTLPYSILWMGDSGLVVLVAAALAIILMMSARTRKLAWAWSAAFIVVTGLVFATKVGLFGWGQGLPQLNFRGPSGHAALATLAWPVVSWALTARASLPVRRLALGAAVVLVTAVCWTLVAHGFHSASEVAAGVALGACGGFACQRVIHASEPLRRFQPLMCGVAVCALLWAQHGERLIPLIQLQIAAQHYLAGDRVRGNRI